MAQTTSEVGWNSLPTLRPTMAFFLNIYSSLKKSLIHCFSCPHLCKTFFGLTGSSVVGWGGQKVALAPHLHSLGRVGTTFSNTFYLLSYITQPTLFGDCVQITRRVKISGGPAISGGGTNAPGWQTTWCTWAPRGNPKPMGTI